MENTKNSLSKTQKNLKTVERIHSSCSTRKRLLDQVFEKERSASRTSSHSKAYSDFKQSSKTLNLKASLQSTQVNPSYSRPARNTKKPQTRPKSPTCIKRNLSEDFSKTRKIRDRSLENTKNLKILNTSKKASQTRPNSTLKPTRPERFDRPERPERLNGTLNKSNASTNNNKRTSKPALNPHAETLAKLVTQFSVQKINDLKNSQVCGNEEMVKVLILLLREVDHHLQESKIVFPEIAQEYFASPGIVVQSIKSLTGFVLAGKIPESKFYLESFVKAHEVYMKVDAVLGSPGFELLASYLENLFKFKKMQSKFVRMLQNFEIEIYNRNRAEAKECRVKYVEVYSDMKEMKEMTEMKDMKEIKQNNETNKIANPQNPLSTSESRPPPTLVPRLPLPRPKHHPKSESCSIPLISILEATPEPSLKPSPQTSSPQVPISFQDSKKLLLDRFFNKMSNPHFDSFSSTNSFPLSDLCNHLNLESKFHASTPFNSTTPRPEGTLSELSRSSNSKSKQDEQKKKNLMIGTRFYKKIDEKLSKLLLEKMKKDSKELLKVKLKDLDEYARGKLVFIEENKEKWVKEVVEELMASEEFNDENEEIAGFKRNALDEYLAQDKVLKGIVSKAQALEAAYRKL